MHACATGHGCMEDSCPPKTLPPPMHGGTSCPPNTLPPSHQLLQAVRVAGMRVFQPPLVLDISLVVLTAKAAHARVAWLLAQLDALVGVHHGGAGDLLHLGGVELHSQLRGTRFRSNGQLDGLPSRSLHLALQGLVRSPARETE